MLLDWRVAVYHPTFLPPLEQSHERLAGMSHANQAQYHLIYAI